MAKTKVRKGLSPKSHHQGSPFSRSDCTFRREPEDQTVAAEVIVVETITNEVIPSGINEVIT